VALPEDGGLVPAGLEVAVQAGDGDIELAVGEPADGLLDDGVEVAVEAARRWRLPREILAGPVQPEAAGVGLRRHVGLAPVGEGPDRVGAACGHAFGDGVRLAQEGSPRLQVKAIRRGSRRVVFGGGDGSHAALGGRRYSTAAPAFIRPGT